MSDKRPKHPIPAVLAIVTRGSACLLVRRANPPDAGYWGFPGGKMEIGETVEEAALRELQEECDLEAESGRVLTALDVFERDSKGCVTRQFVLIAVLCQRASGKPRAGDDALDVGWFTLPEIEESGLMVSRDVARLARQALSMNEAVPSGSPP